MRVNAGDNYKLLKLYVRNLSVESPLTGRLPALINQPNIDIDIDPMIARVADDLYEVAARFTVSASANGVQLYLIEITQAGFFSVAPSDDAHRESLLRRVFPQVIYPAARNNLVSFIVAAGYQPIVLDHIQLENLFTNAVIMDRRPPPPQVERQAGAPRIAAQAATGRRSRLRHVALAGFAAIALMLVLRVDWHGFLARPSGKATAHQAQRQAKAAAQIVASKPRVANVSAVAQNEVSGAPVNLLEREGSDWLMQQEKDAYTVELLRTGDLKKMENIAPIDEGLPMFLIKLPGEKYAVLSGAFAAEKQAAQKAAKSAGYRVMRFGDYR